MGAHTLILLFVLVNTKIFYWCGPNSKSKNKILMITRVLLNAYHVYLDAYTLYYNCRITSLPSNEITKLNAPLWNIRMHGLNSWWGRPPIPNHKNSCSGQKCFFKKKRHRAVPIWSTVTSWTRKRLEYKTPKTWPFYTGLYTTCKRKKLRCNRLHVFWTGGHMGCSGTQSSDETRVVRWDLLFPCVSCTLSPLRRFNLP